jgi:hypothetical protein
MSSSTAATRSSQRRHQSERLKFAGERLADPIDGPANAINSTDKIIATDNNWIGSVLATSGSYTEATGSVGAAARGPAAARCLQTLLLLF